MSQYNTVSPAEVGIMSGMIGAGIGYTIAPRKYNLEQLLTQKPDVFERTFPIEVIKNANPDQNSAHKLLLDAREVLHNARKTNTMEAKLADMLGTPKFTKAYRNIKGLLPKARVQTAIVFGAIGALIGVIGKAIMDSD